MNQRALQLSMRAVALATGGRLRGSGDVLVDGISTDTRDPLQNQLFVALRGERFDAHSFVNKAVDAGARGLIVDERGGLTEERLEALSKRVTIVVVSDTLAALGDLARAHRAHFELPVFGLTGSNGKTTTKELMASLLGVSRRVLATQGNLNNLVGVPMTLFGLDSSHEVAVIEMGMNARGEIARLTEIARPDVGVVTNVGPAHIGMLGSIEAVAAAKGELFLGLDRDRGVCVANADDALVMHAARVSSVKSVRTFGRSETAHVQLLAAEPSGEGQEIRMMIDGAPLTAFLPLIGGHNALNAAAAVAAVTAIPGLASRDTIEPGLASVSVPKGRLMVKHVGRVRVIDDCYNANTASMVAAIETISRLAKHEGARFVALLGEMRELGTFSADEHAKVGQALVLARADLVAAFGPEAAPIAREADRGGLEARHETDEGSLFAWLEPRLRSGDFVLVKGSRGIRMERFIERLEGTN